MRLLLLVEAGAWHFRRKIAPLRRIGVRLTRLGRQRKVGRALGCCIAAAALVASLLMVLIFFSRWRLQKRSSLRGACCPQQGKSVRIFRNRKGSCPTEGTH